MYHSASDDVPSHMLQDISQMSPPFVFLDHDLHDHHDHHDLSLHQGHSSLNPHDPNLLLDHMSPPMLSPSIGGIQNTTRYNHSPLTSFFVMPDGQPQKPARRRRSAGGSDTVKHRRTRSGCFTCRTRRVKCDETHPICERCQKGGRECKYPEVIPTTKSTSAQKRREKPEASREGSSSLEDVEEEDDDYPDGPSPPPEGGPPRLKSTGSQNHLREVLQPRRESWPSSSEHSRRGKSRKTASSAEPSPSPNDPESSAPTSPTGSLRRTTSSYNLMSSSDWSHLPQDVAFYLNYHRQMLTCHHYLLKTDNDDFFKTTLFEHAIKNEALLYAVAAFASFHYSVFYTTGAFQTFLEYYNKSVTLLRVSLNQPHSLATVITILQLASFEEYLGDWASLMEHRNAASKIIINNWTPETMAETSELRLIFNWFCHFDLIGSMMAGHKASISVEWSIKNRQALTTPYAGGQNTLSLKIENALCTFRDLTHMVSVITAKRSEGTMTIEDFRAESENVLQKCYTWWDRLDPVILKGAEQIAPLTSSNPDESYPFKPALLYTGARWAVNFLHLDYYGLVIVLKHQIALTSGGDIDPASLDISSLSDLAIKICGVLAAMEAYNDTPAGALLAGQAPIGLAALWIPNFPQYRRWVQKQLANAEKMGFVYPLAFRNRMSQMWGDPQLKHTWVLSNSETAIGLTIRQLVDMRDSEYPQDNVGRDVRSMRTLMTEMRLDSKGSGLSPPTAGTPPYGDTIQFTNFG